MGAFEKFLTRNYPQTAVYWANPQNDGYGGVAYDAPVEISCRWEEINQVTSPEQGDEKGIGYVSRSIVYVSIDLDEEGCLYLGTLSDLAPYQDSSGDVDFNAVEGIHIIKRFSKSPCLGSTTQFYRRAYLSPWLAL